MGTALVLVAGALLVPSRADAGCDNHAFLRTSTLGDSSSVKRMSPDVQHTLPDPLGSKRPCSGPNCSRGSDPVPLVPVFLSPSTGDQWLYIASLRVTCDDGNADFLGDGQAVHPVRRADPIEPPPRLCLSGSF